MERYVQQSSYGQGLRASHPSSHTSRIDAFDGAVGEQIREFRKNSPEGGLASKVMTLSDSPFTTFEGMIDYVHDFPDDIYKPIIRAYLKHDPLHTNTSDANDMACVHLTRAKMLPVFMYHEGVNKNAKPIVAVDVGTEKKIRDLGEITRAYEDNFRNYAKTVVSQDPHYLLLKTFDFSKLTSLLIDDESRRQFLRRVDKETSAEKTVVTIVDDAVRKGASDVHIEIDEGSCTVRYRIDGSLVQTRHGAGIRGPATQCLANKIKIDSKIDISLDRRIPHDGGIAEVDLVKKGIPEGYSIRTSTIPTQGGESIVLRLLHQSGQKFTLESLGFPPEDYQAITQLVDRPQGLVIVVGPTGSGKTTTLYSILNRLNQPDVKIISAEDPVEMRLPGIMQMQINNEIGITFGKAMRYFLRHDPDDILIGEMRDAETVSVVMQASETGHLVLSTLHTNDATGVIPRFIELGAERSKIVGCLTGVVSQRLVRKVCPQCRENYDARGELGELTGTLIEKEIRVYRKGENSDCEACSGLGYSGRFPVTEIWTLDREAKDLINRRVDLERMSMIRDAAVRSGMTPLVVSSMKAVLAGRTTIDEILKAAVGRDQFTENKEQVLSLLNSS